jgi:hypothetical protein
MRSLAAVVAGYIVLAVLIGLKFALLQQVAPAMFTGVAGLLFILATDALSAAAGGFTTAAVAPARPMAHGAALAAIMVPLGIANAVMNAGQEPLWFQVAVLATIAVTVPLGALLRLRTA